MDRVFADTSFFAAMLNPKDQFHRAASVFAVTSDVETVTTHHVLLELGSMFSRGHRRALFVEFVKSLKASPDDVVIPATDGLFESGLELFESRPDKDWSLTDCISFVVMNRLGITKALSMDHHFEQAGFRSVLKDSQAD